MESYLLFKGGGRHLSLPIGHGAGQRRARNWASLVQRASYLKPAVSGGDIDLKLGLSFDWQLGLVFMAFRWASITGHGLIIWWYYVCFLPHPNLLLAHNNGHTTHLE